MPATIQGPVQATVSTSSLPNPFCPTSEQNRLDTYASRLTVTLPSGYSTFVIGNSKPDESARSSGTPWFRLDSAGRFDRWYHFADGAWLSPHQLMPGAIILWVGDITNISTFDGGSATGSAPYDGPFWEELKDLSATPTPYYGRVAIHPDPSGNLITHQADINLVPAGLTGIGNRIVVGSTGGDEQHTLIDSEMSAHSHPITGSVTAANNGSGAAFTYYKPEPSNSTVSTRDNTNAGQPHQNMPPFFGAYYIRRTARTHYKIDP